MNLRMELKDLKIADNSLLIGITSIPLFFIIPIYIFVVIVAPQSALSVLPTFLEYLFKFLLIFFLLGLLLSRRAFYLLSKAINKPLTIPLAFLISTAGIVYGGGFETFTSGTQESFRQIFPYAAATWFLFPLIQSGWFKAKIPEWLLWTIRVPVWLMVGLSGLILAEIYGANLVVEIIEFNGPNIIN